MAVCDRWTSLDRTIQTPQGAQRWRGRVLRPRASGKGLKYLQVCLTGQRNVTVHRLVLLAFKGEGPAGSQARHINGNSRDNRLVNLCWGTQAENEQDKHRSGTFHNRGPRKLTDEQVRHIRASTDTGLSLAGQFGVSSAAIYSIRTRRNYKHL